MGDNSPSISKGREAVSIPSCLMNQNDSFRIKLLVMNRCPELSVRSRIVGVTEISAPSYYQMLLIGVSCLLLSISVLLVMCWQRLSPVFKRIKEKGGSGSASVIDISKRWRSSLLPIAFLLLYMFGNYLTITASTRLERLNVSNFQTIVERAFSTRVNSRIP